MTAPADIPNVGPIFVGGAPGALPDQVAQWLASALPDRSILPAEDADAKADGAWVHVTRDPITALVSDLRIRRFRRVDSAEERYVNAIQEIEDKVPEARLLRIDLMRLCLTPQSVLPQLEAFLSVKAGALPR